MWDLNASIGCSGASKFNKEVQRAEQQENQDEDLRNAGAEPPGYCIPGLEHSTEAGP